MTNIFNSVMPEFSASVIQKHEQALSGISSSQGNSAVADLARALLGVGPTFQRSEGSKYLHETRDMSAREFAMNTFGGSSNNNGHLETIRKGLEKASVLATMVHRNEEGKAGHLNLGSDEVAAIRSASDFEAARNIVIAAMEKQSGQNFELTLTGGRSNLNALNALSKLVDIDPRQADHQHRWAARASASMVLDAMISSAADTLRRADFGIQGIISNSVPKPGEARSISFGEERTAGAVSLDLSEYKQAMNVLRNDYTYSPLAFDLNGQGFDTSANIIKYDITGDGKLNLINDVSAGLGVLSINNGARGALDLFGNNTDLSGDGKADGYEDGMLALAALAERYDYHLDGILDSNEIKALTEKYQLGMHVGSYLAESRSLMDLGITEIKLSTAATTTETNFDGRGNDLMRQDGATFGIGGVERDYADIWHRLFDPK